MAGSAPDAAPPKSRTLPSQALHQLAKLQSYHRRFGWRATLSRLMAEARRRLASPGQVHPPPAPMPRVGPDWALPTLPPSGRRSAPLFYRIPRGQRRRVTLLCQRIDAEHPADGTRAALALAVVTANRLRADLRLIARQRPVDPHALGMLLRDQGLAVFGECSLCGPVMQRPDGEFDRFDGELVVAASCQCAADALAELPVEDLVCLLHPDDPDLRDAAPGQAGAGALLERAGLRFVVGWQAFRQHLVGRGFTRLARDALVFEPAVAADAALPAQTGDRRDAFLFEVMAPVDRDRFAVGLDAIEQALARKVLDPQRWDFLFAAPGLPQVTLGHGQRPTSLDHLDASAAWQARQRAILALRLPPPDAPFQQPADAAADNAIVVVATTNGADGDPAMAAAGVIRCRLERDAVVEALRRAAERLDDGAWQHHRPARVEPARDWALALDATAEQLTAGR